MATAHCLLSGATLFSPGLEQHRLGWILFQHCFSTGTILGFLISKAFLKALPSFCQLFYNQPLNATHVLITDFTISFLQLEVSFHPLSLSSPLCCPSWQAILKLVLRHILNVMLHLSHAEIYLGCLKPDFSRVQNYITSELFNTLSFHLCLLKLGVNVAQGAGGKTNQTKKSFVTFM